MKADFNSVATPNLMGLARRACERYKQNIDNAKFMTKKEKTRRKQEFERTMLGLEAKFAEFQLGLFPEADMRSLLMTFLGTD